MKKLLASLTLAAVLFTGCNNQANESTDVSQELSKMIMDHPDIGKEIFLMQFTLEGLEQLASPVGPGAGENAVPIFDIGITADQKYKLCLALHEEAYEKCKTKGSLSAAFTCYEKTMNEETCRGFENVFAVWSNANQSNVDQIKDLSQNYHPGATESYHEAVQSIYGSVEIAVDTTLDEKSRSQKILKRVKALKENNLVFQLTSD